MLPKAHLTSRSRMSGSRWVITLSWLSGLQRFFLNSSSVYSCHLFLISSASVRSIPFLSFIEPIFAWNIHLVSLIFLQRSLGLSHSIVFLYFFALITEESFLISPCYSLELCIQIGISFLFLLCLLLLFFSQLFVRPPQTTILLFCISNSKSLNIFCSNFWLTFLKHMCEKDSVQSRSTKELNRFELLPKLKIFLFSSEYVFYLLKLKVPTISSLI